MKQPGSGTMLIGHPVIVVPASIVGLLTIGSAFVDRSNWPIAMFAFLVLVPLVKASEQRVKFLAWKREWDGMAGPSQPTAAKLPRKAQPVLGGLMLAGLGVFFAANASDPTYAMALVWLVLAVIIAGAVALISRALKAKAVARPSKAVPVSICVRGPLLPVPSMMEAYRALPPHCQALFAAQQQRR